MQALEAGAVDVVTKPRVDTAQFLQDSAMHICDIAKAAAHAKLKGTNKAPPPHVAVEPKLTADAVLPALAASRKAVLLINTPRTEPVHRHWRHDRRHRGAARGARGAARENAPAIVIVQHMPEKFTNAFARRWMAPAGLPSRRPRTVTW